MREIAYAKLNLALHVLGRGPDGYHQLDTLFAFAEDGDLLHADEGEGLSLRIEGPFAPGLSAGEDNLVLKAARVLKARYAVSGGAALTLEKRLPVAAGIGGGSADAAATLRLLNRFWGLHASADDLLPLARTLGADVPACLLSRTCRGTGRGDELASATSSGLEGLPVLLVNPGFPLSTAEVFRAWRGPSSGLLGPDPFADTNDLELAAVALAPAVADVLEALRACEGARLVRMSGSGATCFALFDSEGEREAAKARIAGHPGWWTLSSRLR
jgi:4-diphosphocytidyl-2-C-methyl-D-erythritol kinase